MRLTLPLATVLAIGAGLALPGLESASPGGSLAIAASLKPLAPEDAWNSEPIYATSPPGDRRVFVVERGTPEGMAAIRVFEDGALDPVPFLSIANISLEGERGLLSMAFAPDYATSGLLYVFYVAAGPDQLDPEGNEGDIRVVEYRRSGSDPDRADPGTARLVLTLPHSPGYHNGGWLGFGPDDLLYVAIGDDHDRDNAPSLASLSGKVLRIDPSDPDGAGPATLTVPDDNPFVSTPGARGEIYTRGLRNPWRASFAPGGGLTVADVGQNSVEEINYGDLAGRNMGWPDCEGRCETPFPEYTEPFYTYSHLDGCAVIGGYVIRDPDLSGLTGRYLYGDACRQDLRTLNLSAPGGDPAASGLEIEAFEGLRSFGEDSLGCAYVMTSLNAYRIAAGNAAPTGCPHDFPVADPPEPPPVPADSVPPGLTLTGKARRLGKRIPVFVECSEDCTVRAGGKLLVRRRARQKAFRLRLLPATGSGPAMVRKKLALRLKPRALRTARAAYRNGRKMRVSILATATDDVGNSASEKLGLRIRRHRSRPG
ncbi:MAG: PQQ-dependent sugar dehydrogenase [Solirubrobacterales bacterium]|nr:PQQ-dependent sugar dehydrogenase [Solirubrobacterales bacterium]